ncbi:helix-turn-helix domain-containing protein [Streptomyces sp. SID8361]|uniref:helix-turn-helix domain-containing protein n=1 Tax=Streptomyces TaxID=1883 RepID=UPI00081E0E13|nr:MULTISPECIES: helix-turn-helix transcriptional regulator [unclassified Streptomyces]AUA12222.1 helix-turn-helix protein [Streptomyces sp. M56]MYU12704.1 helix-turn-helix domain-containing protein [Streptomyces sp. SID8361]MYX63225.1 helix-turn-helix domain-containing protein [Streptomyces sp. SID8382]SCF94319.1 Helix-turn-helix domain-containing protein [Streptomyces sp. MnatMP-M27]
MALRTNPTERQRRLGAELRRLREQAGLTLNEAGALIDMGRVHLTHVEGGRTAIPTDRLRRLCEGYGCTSSPFIGALVSLAEDKGKGWWSDYKNTMPAAALDLAELESRAVGLRSYESLFIPGIFQSEDYTRAIFRGSDVVANPVDIDRAVEFRIQRQTALTGDEPPTIHAVIHEAALHMRFGGSAVTRKQLLRLVELAELPHVTIQVLPFTADGVPMVNTPFNLIASHGGILETIQMDHASRSMFLHDPDSVTEYQRHFDRLRTEALPPVVGGPSALSHDVRDSLGLIQHILYSHY